MSEQDVVRWPRKGQFSSPAERFWARVDRSEPDGCWPWLLSVDRRPGYGYGTAWPGGGRPPMPAHRLAWELEHGPVPEGMYVLHRCDNPPCVRPDHLFLGTYADNARDCVAKGRWRGGRRRADGSPARRSPSARSWITSPASGQKAPCE